MKKIRVMQKNLRKNSAGRTRIRPVVIVSWPDDTMLTCHCVDIHGPSELVYPDFHSVHLLTDSPITLYWYDERGKVIEERYVDGSQTAPMR